MADKSLSDEQKKALAEAKSYIRQAIGETKNKLAEAGLIPDLGAHFECLECGCDKFEIGAGALCANSTCKHSFFDHNLPI